MAGYSWAYAGILCANFVWFAYPVAVRHRVVVGCWIAAANHAFSRHVGQLDCYSLIGCGVTGARFADDRVECMNGVQQSLTFRIVQYT